jgi:IQ calmodulin-binding motif
MLLASGASIVGGEDNGNDGDHGPKEEEEEEGGGGSSVVTARTVGSTTAHTRTSSSLPTRGAATSSSSYCHNSEEDATTVTTTTSLFQKLDGLHVRWTTTSSSSHSSFDATPYGPQSTEHFDVQQSNSQSQQPQRYTSSRPYALATQYGSGGGAQGDDEDASSVLSMGSFASSLQYHARRTRSSGIVSPKRRRGQGQMQQQSSSSRRSHPSSAARSTPPSAPLRASKPSNASSKSVRSRQSWAPGGSVASSSTTTGRDHSTARESVFDRLYNDALAQSERKKQRERDRDRDSVHSANSVSFYSARQHLSECSHAGPCEDFDGNGDDVSSVDYSGNDSVFDRLYRNEKRCCRYRHRVSPKNVAPTSLERRLSYKPNFAGTTPNLHSPHWQQRLRDANTAAAVAVPVPGGASPTVFERLYRNEPRSSPVLPPSALRPGPLHRRLSASPRHVKFGTPATLQGSLKPPPMDTQALDSPDTRLDTYLERPMTPPQEPGLTKDLDFDCSGRDLAATLIQSTWRGCWCRMQVVRETDEPGVSERVAVEESTADRLREELKAVAATILQAQWRCTTQRQRYLTVRCSAIVIQSAFRAHYESLVLAVATKLQSWWRMCRARYAYRATRLSCRVVQRTVRDHLVSRRQAENVAATILQAAFRRRVAKSSYKSVRHAVLRIQRLHRLRRLVRLRFSASTRLQSWWRGIERLRRAALAASNDRCAVTAQAWWKSVRARRSYCRIKLAVVRCQSLWRSYSCQLEFARRRKAASAIQHAARRRRQERIIHAATATRIQSWWRAMAAAMTYSYTRQCAVLIQRMIRIHLAASRLKHASATRLSSNWRCFVAQRQYGMLLSQVMAIQRAWRHCSLAMHAIQLHESARARTDREACVRLQSTMRTYLVLKSYGNQRQLAIRLQSIFRGRQSRKKVEFQRTRRAAITIQCHVRGDESRTHRNKSLRSAVRLQSLWRGHSSRQMVASLRVYCAATVIQSMGRCSKAKSILSVARASATLIQSFVRGRLVHFKLRRFLNAVRVVQLFVRRRQAMLIHQRYRERERAAIWIQAWWRGCASRSAFTVARAAAVLIESFLRGRRVRLKHRELMYRQSSGAIVIQSAWRTCKCRGSFNLLRLSAISIQSQVRRRKYQTRYSRTRASALHVQRPWKSRQARLDERSKRYRAAILVQALARQRLGARQYSDLLNQTHKSAAAITIQSRWRLMNARFELSLALAAAVMIQAAFRGRRTRLALQSMTQSTVIFQKNARRFVAERAFRRCRMRVVKVQSSWRGSIARSRHTRAITAAVILQSRFRGHLMKAQFVCIQRAVVTLQSAWRCAVARGRLATSLCAAKMIQSVVRSNLQRKLYDNSCRAATRIQTIFRGDQARTECHRKRIAVSRLQGAARSFSMRRRNSSMRSAAICIQSWWRLMGLRSRFAAATYLAERLQSHSRGAMLRDRLRLERESATKIQVTYRDLAGTLATRRRRIVSARVIQWRWRTFAFRRKYAVLDDAARTIQIWYFSIRLRVQQHRLQSSVALLRRCTHGSFRRGLSCFSLVQVNGVVRSSALATLTRLKMQRGQSLVPDDVNRKWNHALEEARHFAAVILQSVVRTFLCRRWLCDGPLHPRRPVAVRLLTRRIGGSVDVALCPILQRKRNGAAQLLQRFFAERVRLKARESQARVETEWIVLRAERAASKLVQELLSKDFNMGVDSLRGLGHCIPRLAHRARAADDHVQETLQSRARDCDGGNGEITRANSCASRSQIHYEAWDY